MDMNKEKIRCPKCEAIYSIKNKTKLMRKKSATCVICNTFFFIANRGVDKTTKNVRSQVTFLKSYFEKRSGISRRNARERRKDIQKEYLSKGNFSYDIIPIFNNDGNEIIGHISPGRRLGKDRRKGIDRRQ
jgi:hypothetical protein